MRKLLIAVVGILTATLLSSGAFAYTDGQARGVKASSNVVKVHRRHVRRVKAHRHVLRVHRRHRYVARPNPVRHTRNSYAPFPISFLYSDFRPVAYRIPSHSWDQSTNGQ